MGSEKEMNDATSFHQSDMPILCANGCGFFGTAATMNLCSKCYRDFKLQEEQAASAKAAVEKSMATQPTKVVVVAKPASVEIGQSSAADVPMEEEELAAPAKATNRCGTCNKKVGVMGFKCRCGGTFCGSHRYAEEHCCSFDFKGAGRNAIAKANPVVKADKLERF